MTSSKKRPNPKADGWAILWQHYIADDPACERMVEDELVNLDIAQQIYDLRMDAGYTQQQLAKMIGTTASVICRLEDADYNGHSLSMLRRIAAAFGKTIEVRFVEKKLVSPTSRMPSKSINAKSRRSARPSTGKTRRKPKR